MKIVEQPAGRLAAVPAAHGSLSGEQTTLAALQLDCSMGAGRRVGRNEVDHAADRLRAVHDLAASLQNLDAAHAVDGRRVVHFWFAIRRQGDRYPILEHQNGTAAIGIQTPNRDIQTHGDRSPRAA